jgi:hypothetical protein
VARTAGHFRQALENQTHIGDLDMEELNQEIQKLKFQIQLIAESINSKEYPIAPLVISMDWNENDLDRAHNIFEKYEKLIEDGEAPNWNIFESDFREHLSIDYQALKSIVLAFYRNSQWESICMEYAKANECMEFHVITKPRSF